MFRVHYKLRTLLIAVACFGLLLAAGGTGVSPVPERNAERGAACQRSSKAFSAMSR